MKARSIIRMYCRSFGTSSASSSEASSVKTVRGLRVGGSSIDRKCCIWPWHAQTGSPPRKRCTRLLAMHRRLAHQQQRLAGDTVACTRRPELVRDFISSSLYHPEHGYFQKHANIFKTAVPISFGSLRDQDHYTSSLAAMYTAQSRNETFYQLWHTPSELFRPHYGNAIARYIVAKRPSDNVRIVEVGAGNGTLCENILDYLAEHECRLFTNVQYHIIEISAHLARHQRQRLERFGQRVVVHEKSVLHWDTIHSSPVFVLAMEVLDNLAHDRIMYAADGSLSHGVVYTNDAARYGSWPGRYAEVYEPCTDALTLEAVGLLDTAGHVSPSLRWSLRDVFAPLKMFNPWRTEFIPTNAIQMLKSITRCFPNHRLVFSDFRALPETIAGWGAPRVQTRYRGDTVSCTDYLLQPGLFDIFFPVDLRLLAKVYTQLAGTQRQVSVVSHAAFCQQWADTARTRTLSGYNPLLEDFANVDFFLCE